MFPVLFGFDYSVDYDAMLMWCVTTGNDSIGKQIVYERNKKLQALKLQPLYFSYDEYGLLAKIIQCEAGSNWLPIEWKMAVGDVVLNRVLSPEFPNTIHEVVFQPGQYPYVNGRSFLATIPSDDSASAALRVLSGEHIIDDRSVVFQANVSQGGGVYCIMHDDLLGNTYFCYSSHRDVYN